MLRAGLAQPRTGRLTRGDAHPFGSQISLPFISFSPLMEPILLAHGYKVTTAETVAIANALLSAVPFDLAICDVNLPDGSGLTVADRAAAAGVKALVVTGQGLSLRPGSLSAYDYML